ncbi:MAG: threonine--tRNA ligase, partial [Proteobacteria bacterium]|nr:threonine--tRNA ligase [Pseudomonadota bacterium]
MSHGQSDLTLYKIRHSMAHVLAQAVKAEFREANLGFGPPTEFGFYYDFDFANTQFSDSDLKRIQRRMKKIIAAQATETFAKQECTFDEAIQMCEEYNEPYKKEYVRILNSRGVKIFSFYRQGDFLDLCDGPHVTKISELPIDGFKLDRISGAYWLSDESKAMLTRIYAYCFTTKQELDDHLVR